MRAMRQAIVPREVLGRVTAAWRLGGQVVTPLGAILAGTATGLLGAWFHSGGRPYRAVTRVVSAWALPAGQNGGEKPGAAPPVLAPLAFSGLGLLGLLVCAGRSNGIR